MILLCRQPIYEPRPVWSAFYISLSIVHKSCVLSLTALFVIKILAHPPGPCMSQPTARNTCLSIPAPVTYNHYHITPHCRSTNQELGIFNSWSTTIHHGDLHPSCYPTRSTSKQTSSCCVPPFLGITQDHKLCALRVIFYSTIVSDNGVASLSC